MSSQKSSQVYAFTFVLAFCSLFYELVYAQILSVCLGGTKNQYLTIISIFTCALGFGSIAQAKLGRSFSGNRLLFFIEIGLIFIGLIGPFFIVWILQPDSSAFIKTASAFASYGLVFFVGFLSGFEIPCLFAMVEDAQGKILAYDYLGMLAASVLFPFVFLPYLGTSASLLLVVGFNLIALVWLSPLKPNPKVGAYIFTGVYLTAVVSYRTELNLLLSNLYLGRA